MKKMNVKELLSIVEAIEILSSVAEIDPSLTDETHFTEHQIQSLHPQKWLDESEIEQNEELIIDAFHSIYRYFTELKKKNSALLTDDHTKKGIRSIWHIIEEARGKIETYTQLFHRKGESHGLTESSEYRQLKETLHSILPQKFLEENKSNKKPIKKAQSTETEISTFSKAELDDIENIKNDVGYEFFYVKRDDGKSFYTYDCIRRLKQIYDVSLIEEMVNEPVARMRLLEAKDFQNRAIDILKATDTLIAEFRGSPPGFIKSNPLASALNKAVLALLFCSSPRNLPSHSAQLKQTAEYFMDFKQYLREAFKTDVYLNQGIDSKRESTHKKLVLLAHKLCFSYFISLSLRKDVVTFLRKIIGLNTQDSSICDILLSEDTALREALAKGPGGPLHKVIMAFLRGETEEGWDPLNQKNVPSRLFSIVTQDKNIHLIRIPAPVQQTNLKAAKVVEEFEVFVEQCLSERKEKILIIDLQDATSLEEYARTSALDRLAKNKTYSRFLSLLRLPKKTSFYLQEDIYNTLKEGVDVTDFIDSLKEQIKSGENCGFSFPEGLKEKDVSSFSSKVISLVKKIFFSECKTLNQRQRQDFIEIFYFFFLLKIIDKVCPDYVAFTSKDGLDSVLSTSAELFFCLTHIFSPKLPGKEERDFLLWLLYGPVLLLRERAIDKKELIRSAHVMETFQKGAIAHSSELKKSFYSLFTSLIFDHIEE